MSPLPNPTLWNPYTVGKLQTQECFGSGGWWHDRRILAATGDGIEKEEPKAWKGWWNEQVVGPPISVVAPEKLLKDEGQACSIEHGTGGCPDGATYWES